jgi:hypothetical protein
MYRAFQTKNRATKLESVGIFGAKYLAEMEDEEENK